MSKTVLGTKRARRRRLTKRSSVENHALARNNVAAAGKVRIDQTLEVAEYSHTARTLICVAFIFP